MEKYIIEAEKEYKGLKYVVIFHAMGHRCGYVGTENFICGQDDGNFHVHGGITYSENDTQYPIVSNLYWIGFDCLHMGDAKDVELIHQYGLISDEMKEHSELTENLLPIGGTIRTLDYVEQECRDLIDQILLIKETN